MWKLLQVSFSSRSLALALAGRHPDDSHTVYSGTHQTVTYQNCKSDIPSKELSVEEACVVYQ